MKNLWFVWGVLNDAAHPDVVSINLTPYCNQHCKYCEIGKGQVQPDRPILNLSDIQWIIDQMVEEKIPLISIGGGEPLTVRWLWDVIRYAHEKGVKTEIITNGMLIPSLTPEQLDVLKMTYNISVSIDAFDHETEDWLRGVKGALLKQKEGLGILQKNKISFTIATVLTNYNYNKISYMVRFVDMFQAKFVKFQPLWQGSNFPDVKGIDKTDLAITKEHIPALISELEHIVGYEQYQGFGVKTNASDLLDWISLFLNSDRSVPLYKSFVEKYWCHSLHAILTINYYGDILPCNYLAPVANIKDREESNLLVAMWDRTCSDARKSFKKGDYFPECCGCTSSLEIGLICSGIRYPIRNRAMLSQLPKMIKARTRKQRTMQ